MSPKALFNYQGPVLLRHLDPEARIPREAGAKGRAAKAKALSARGFRGFWNIEA